MLTSQTVVPASSDDIMAPPREGVEEEMTLGIAIQCPDGIVFACDSLTIFGRGVPVSKYTNKVHLIEHDGLEHPVAVLAGGAVTFFNKFRDRADREAISGASEALQRKLDVVDFTERVCERIVMVLFKEYLIDRSKFFGTVSDFSLSLIVAGATRDNELRAYHVHGDGISEVIEDYGTLGSGAAYGELFLRYLFGGEQEVDTALASRLAVYAVKGVELMDPNVGGPTNVVRLNMDNGNLKIEALPTRQMPKGAKDEMEGILLRMSEDIGKLAGELSSKKKGRK